MKRRAGHDGACAAADPDLVVVGDCNPDVLVLGDDVTPSFGQQEKLVDGIWLVVGGSAAITAVAAARLGLSVALVAAVGADPAGDFMLDQLAREGVGTEAVAVRDGHADRHDRGAVPRRRPGHPHRARRHSVADRCGRPRRRCSPGPATCISARTSCWSTRSGPGWPACWPPPGPRAPAPRSTPTGTRPGAGATSGCAPRWRRPTCCSPTRRRPLRLAGAPGLAAAARALTAAGPGLVVKLGERGVALRGRGRQWHRVGAAAGDAGGQPPARGTASTPG